MQNKKSVVLSSSKSAEKAVLTLQEGKNVVSGTVRLYNFSRELEGICSLGLCHDKKVDKAGLTLKGHMLYEFTLSIDKIPEKFSVAVVNFVGGEPSPILFGSSQQGTDEIYANIISEISKNKSFENTKNVLDNFGVDFEEEEKAEIESEIDKALSDCNGKCENCVYKNFFFSQNSKSEVFEAKNEEKMAKKVDFSDFEENLNKKEEENENAFSEENEEKKDLFFNRLKPQIDKLFEENPSDEGLESLIPSSKWVRVEYEDEGDFFVFGLLFDEDGNVQYVCYGVPSVFEEEPPVELSGYPIWVPLAEKDGFGYWLTYQDASTGEPVRAVIS